LTVTGSSVNGPTYNGLTLTSNATGFSVAGGTTSKNLTVDNNLTLTGTDGSTLNVATGGTLGTEAFANIPAIGFYEPQGYSASNTIGMAGCSTTYICVSAMVPNQVNISFNYVAFALSTLDSSASHYYDVGIAGPCAPNTASCPIIFDVGSASGTSAGSWNSNTSFNISVPCLSTTTCTLLLTPPPPGQYYYFVYAGTINTAHIQAGQISMYFPVNGATSTTASGITGTGQTLGSSASTTALGTVEIPAASYASAANGGALTLHY
jgi:hypothetical protein